MARSFAPQMPKNFRSLVELKQFCQRAWNAAKLDVRNLRRPQTNLSRLRAYQRVNTLRDSGPTTRTHTHTAPHVHVFRFQKSSADRRLWDTQAAPEALPVNQDVQRQVQRPRGALIS